jgi:putative addiction module component (TIGR02574 family)
MTRFQALEHEALSLEPEERATLAETLLASLDTPEDIEKAWAEELDRRSADFDSGAVQGIPLDVVMAEVRALLE